MRNGHLGRAGERVGSVYGVSVGSIYSDRFLYLINLSVQNLGLVWRWGEYGLGLPPLGQVVTDSYHDHQPGWGLSYTGKAKDRFQNQVRWVLGCQQR